jgi:hypothetical protein
MSLLWGKDAPVRLYGPGIVALPVGFFTAHTRTEQIDLLYSIADAPETPRIRAEALLRTIKRIEQRS